MFLQSQKSITIFWNHGIAGSEAIVSGRSFEFWWLDGCLGFGKEKSNKQQSIQHVIYCSFWKQTWTWYVCLFMIATEGLSS